MDTSFYEVLPREPGHYRIREKTRVGMDLFLGEREALLLDTGYGCGALRETVDALRGDLPLTVVNTHGHCDHAGGNFRFIDCPVWMAPEDAALYAKHGSEDFRRYCYRSADTIVGEQVADEESYCTAKMPDTLPLSEGKIFDLGGRRLRVYAFPGHTAGSIGLVDENTGILYTGDAMNFATWMFLPESGTLSEYRASIRKAIALNCPSFYVSHGDALLPPSYLARFLRAAEELRWEDGEIRQMSERLTGGAEVRKLILPAEGELPACAIFISKEKMK